MPYMGLDSPALRQLVADYYNCISRLDSLVGDLMDVLENSGKAHNTIVIYLGDHGADMLRKTHVLRRRFADPIDNEVARAYSAQCQSSVGLDTGHHANHPFGFEARPSR